MKSTRNLLLVAASVAAMSSVSQAAITWIGGGGPVFWNPANWSGGAPVAGGVTNDNIFISHATVTNIIADFSILTLGEGFSMTVTNTNLDFIGAAPKLVQGVAGGTQNSINLNNSVLRTQSISTGIIANLGTGSQLSVGGAGRAINSQAEISQVNMALGTLVVFEAGSNDPAGDNLSGLDRGNGWSIINNVTGQSYSADRTVGPLTDFVVAGLDTNPFRALSGGDGTNQGIFSITAIPEPSSLGLVGLAALGFLRRRRA
ncbi:MAG: PEP-CTERM sorting domain-containing protein [Verrucomicrobia bacterium]|nr:MAG: PEP-CTERM sorting domain-containing protein [Verrucomicrobiota bacterium]